MLTVAALYKFTPFSMPDALRAPLRAICEAKGVRGSLLLAPEGINGTIAGPAEGIDTVLTHIRGLPGCGDVDVKFSTAAAQPFGRLKVRLKREIVTMGRPEADPTQAVGTYVEARDWNALITAPDVVVIDTRNAYETEIGTFHGAVDPQIESFGDFPKWWEKTRDRWADKRVAMFCTGGIRCEKSTAYLKAQGVAEVYHLRGGILRYLEDMPEADSLWKGACFVFDERVALGHGLQETDHSLCYACRGPVSRDDRAHEAYEEGVSCPRCADRTAEADKGRFRERQRQIALAKARGMPHVGALWPPSD